MAAVSLTTLRALAREKADMPVAGFVANSATGIDSYINEGISILHGKLIGAFGSDYSDSSGSATPTTGVAAYALPSDFFKLWGVDLTVAGEVVTLQPYMRNERNYYRNQTNNMLGGRSRYKLTGTAVITFYPIIPAGLSFQLYYAPNASVLVNTGDTVTFPNGWERYVVYHAAIQMKAKGEEDTRELRTELARMDAELKELIEQRDGSFPLHATDVELLEVDPRFW